MRILKFIMDQQLSLLRQRTNRGGQWEESPMTVNAYYQPVKNEIGRAIIHYSNSNSAFKLANASLPHFKKKRNIDSFILI